MGETKSPATDSDIRDALRGWLKAKQSGSSFLLVEELGIRQGIARIDMAVVNSRFEGFEIKSDRDSLRRLEHQIKMYSSVLDRATIVVSRRHLENARQSVPEWWGILLYDNDGSAWRLKEVRKSKRNKFVDPRALVELLWYSEAIDFLEERSLARGVRGKPRQQVWDRVCQYCKTKEIADRVRAQLRARKGIIAAVSP